MAGAPRPSFLQRMRCRLAQCDRRLVWILPALVLLSPCIFWRPIQRQCLIYFLLRSDAPSPEVLSDVANQSRDPKSLLLHLWQTQRIPHHHFVLTYLGQAVNTNPGVFRALEPILLDAAGDADIETRELAFAALARAKHPRLRGLALEQLEDADPAARVLGLRTLRSIATSNDVPIAIRLLSDPEPRVVVAAASALRHVVALDVGIRSSHALPQFIGMGTNAPAPPDLDAIGQGVQRWQDWWKEHQTEYPAARQPSRIRRKPVGLATRDFSLKDSTGKPVHLSDYRGRAVLLAFCGPDAPDSFDGVPALVAVQNRSVGRTAVLAICIPPAPSCADEDEHGTEQHHHHHDETPSPVMLVHGTILDHKATFPMLFDSKGTVGLRFDVQNLPTYVLIDAQGVIRRRFVGNRTRQVLEAMIVELTDANANHTGNP